MWIDSQFPLAFAQTPVGETGNHVSAKRPGVRRSPPLRFSHEGEWQHRGILFDKSHDRRFGLVLMEAQARGFSIGTNPNQVQLEPVIGAARVGTITLLQP